MTDTIVILAGGMSSRMKKSQDTELDNKKVEQANKSSKSLITFGNNKPFIFYLLKLFQKLRNKIFGNLYF